MNYYYLEVRVYIVNYHQKVTKFLQNCLNNDIIPDGLSSGIPNAVAKQ